MTENINHNYILSYSLHTSCTCFHRYQIWRVVGVILLLYLIILALYHVNLTALSHIHRTNISKFNKFYNKHQCIYIIIKNCPTLLTDLDLFCFLFYIKHSRAPPRSFVQFSRNLHERAIL